MTRFHKFIFIIGIQKIVKFSINLSHVYKYVLKINKNLNAG